MNVVQFNEKEDPSACITRLCHEAGAEVIVALDCASRHVPFTVLGFFVIPKTAMKPQATDGA